MNANQMINALIAIENQRIDADERRVIRNRRIELQAATQRGDGKAILQRMAQARDTAQMWGHEIAK